MIAAQALPLVRPRGGNGRDRARAHARRRGGPDLEPARRARRPGCASSRASSTRRPATFRATRMAPGAAASTANPAFEPLELRTWPHRGAAGSRRGARARRVDELRRALGEEARARLLAGGRGAPRHASRHTRPRRHGAALRDRALHDAQARSEAAAPSCQAAARRAVATGGLVPVEVLLELPVVDLLAVVGPFLALLAEEGVVDVVAERRCAAPSRASSAVSASSRLCGRPLMPRPADSSSVRW